MALVTLTTDFGLADPFVGSMKGVILSICPQAVLVDLSHEIPRHAVAGGAYIFNQCRRYFPRGSVHLVVVDPGVGSSRRPLVCSAHGHYAVGPDNGVLADFCDGDPASECFEIAASDFVLTVPAESPTFQGRDVFAPAAAHLARGVPASAFGPRVSDPVRIKTPRAESGLHGEIVWIDRFGNLISNLHLVGSPRDMAVEVMGRVAPLVGRYAQGPQDLPAALINSDQVVEVFVNRGDAAAALGAAIGARITLVKHST